MKILGAFLWLRWRLMVNGLFGGKGRDAMAWLATWAAVLVRILLGLILLGAIATLSLVAGILAAKLADPSGLGPDAAILGFRVVLGVLSVVLVLFPLMTRAGGDLAAAQRLRLLPVKERQLDLLDIAGAFADPWLMAVSPIPLVMAIVLWWKGHAGWGLIALVAGALMLCCFALASTVMRRVVGLVLRDRRRAETAALILIVGLMVLSTGTVWLEPLIEGTEAGKPDEIVVVDENGREVERLPIPATPVTDPEISKPEVTDSNVTDPKVTERGKKADQPSDLRDVARKFPAALQPLPSELFVRALVSSLEGRHGTTAACLAALAALVVVLALVARRLWHLTVGSPAVTGRARASSRRFASLDRLPGLSPAASAVAWAQATTAVRTLAGKLAFAMPTLAMLIVIIPVRTLLEQEESFVLDLFQGPQMALGVVAFAMLGIQPFALNQFASDGEGLARQILLPLRPRDLLVGKAVGLGLLVGVSSLVAVLAVSALVARGSVGSWLAIVLTVLPIYLLMAPVSVALSLYFPKAMDLGGMGNKSKPHQLATLLALMALAVILGPVFGLVGVGLGLLGAPWLTLLGVLVLAFVAYAVWRVFLHFAAPVFPTRAEAILAAIREK